MDTRKIESIGVESLLFYINQMECAQPYINTDDKYPLWDGEILVYLNSATL